MEEPELKTNTPQHVTLVGVNSATPTKKRPSLCKSVSNLGRYVIFKILLKKIYFYNF